MYFQSAEVLKRFASKVAVSSVRERTQAINDVIELVKTGTICFSNTGTSKIEWGGLTGLYSEIIPYCLVSLISS